MEITDIFFALITTLLGVISYFLKSLISKFEGLQSKVEQFIIRFTALETRTDIIFTRLENLESKWERLQERMLSGQEDTPRSARRQKSKGE